MAGAGVGVGVGAGEGDGVGAGIGAGAGDGAGAGAGVASPQPARINPVSKTIINGINNNLFIFDSYLLYRLNRSFYLLINHMVRSFRFYFYQEYYLPKALSTG
jgi:hypothetical protein